MLRNRSSGKFSPLATAAMLAAALIVASGEVMAKTPKIDALKAAFVFNFAKFTSWPPANEPGRELVFCFLEGTLHRGSFSDWDEKKKLHGARVRTRVVDTGSVTLEGCHVFFAGGDGVPRRRLADLGTYAKRHHVLLISDAPGLPKAREHIRLRIVDNRLKFRINLEAARDAGLKLSSQLLRLAENVDT